MINDLTTGKPSKRIWDFSLPLLLSTALQQIYNIADSVIVGRFTGSAGLAAIGSAYPITLFFIAAATGSSMGCSVVISQMFGAHKISGMKSAVFTAIISLGILGAVLSCLGAALSGALMHALNASSEIFDDARIYLAVYSVGVFPMFVYNTANAVYTGLGDSKRPLYFLLFSSVLNIVLDIIAVGPLNMGVTGAAWATAVSVLTAAVLASVTLVRRIQDIKTDEPVKVFSRAILARMSRVAVPSIFQQSCVALAHTVVQSLVNTYSTAVIAGYEAASKVHNFAYMSFNTLGTALSSFAAQNYGAGLSAGEAGDSAGRSGFFSRIRSGYRASTTICFVLTAAVVAVMQIFPRQLLGLFADAGAERAMIEAGSRFLRIISPDYLIICFIITYGGLFRGVGRVMDFLVLTILDFTVRVTMCFVLTKLLDSYTGLFWAWYFGSVADVIPCIIIFRRMFAKNGRLGVRATEG